MNKVHLQDIKLQELRIPTGWTVTWNQLYDIEPGTNIKVEGLPDGDVWELFIQDLLQLKYVNRNFVLDVGWVPEASPEGSYQLTLVANENWNDPIVVYQCRNKDEIVEQINLLLLEVIAGNI